MIGDPFKIAHLILLPKNISEEGQTLFQGFSRSLIDEFEWVYSKLVLFPHHFFEYDSTLEEIVRHRIFSPSLSIYFISETNDIGALKNESYFYVIWTSENTYDVGMQLCNQFIYEPLHITAREGGNAIYFQDLKYDSIEQHFINIYKIITSKISEGTERINDSDFRKSKIDNNDKIIKSFYHNIYSPVLAPLIWYGYEAKLDQLNPAAKINFYIKHLKYLIILLDKVRKSHINQVIEEPLNDAIIYCPSIYASLYKTRGKFWQIFSRNIKINSFQKEFILKSIVKMKDYSTFSIAIDKEYNPYDDSLVRPFLVERQKELSIFTLIISIVTCSQFIPGIRLPSSLMLGGCILDEIGRMFKAKKQPSQVKLNRKFLHYSEYIRNNIGKELLKICFKQPKNIVAICDFPIEWLSINNIPIMFTHEISRISPTPGNLLQFQLLSNDMINVHYTRLFDILIIRSFYNNDKIKNILSDSVNHIKTCSKNLNIDLKDVSNKQEVLNYLNSHNGLITIFDCHGDHGGLNAGGWIKIGNEKIDIWELYGKCKVSPIIILSACSTHPIDGSHASVANGFLNCGAFCVIGTYASIQALHNSSFIANLLNYISSYLPLILSNGGSITWRKFVSNIFKISYLADIINDMKGIYEIDVTKFNKIFNQTTKKINMGNPNWHRYFKKRLATILKINLNEINNLFLSKYQYTPTMLYTQLGSPEKIRIHNENDNIT